VVLQQDPKLGAFDEAFLNYLNLKLDNDESKEESDELISGYLEAVNGAFSGSPEEAGAKTDFVKTVYAKVCAILRQSDTKSRYKVVVSALQLIKDHTHMFREHLLTEGPIEIFAVLQKLCDLRAKRRARSHRSHAVPWDAGLRCTRQGGKGVQEVRHLEDVEAAL